MQPVVRQVACLDAGSEAVAGLFANESKIGIGCIGGEDAEALVEEQVYCSYVFGSAYIEASGANKNVGAVNQVDIRDVAALPEEVVWVFPVDSRVGCIGVGREEGRGGAAIVEENEQGALIGSTAGIELGCAGN